MSRPPTHGRTSSSVGGLSTIGRFLGDGHFGIVAPAHRPGSLPSKHTIHSACTKRLWRSLSGPRSSASLECQTILRYGCSWGRVGSLLPRLLGWEALYSKRGQACFHMISAPIPSVPNTCDRDPTPAEFTTMSPMSLLPGTWLRTKKQEMFCRRTCMWGGSSRS
jgi:hypothetical protein